MSKWSMMNKIKRHEDKYLHINKALFFGFGINIFCWFLAFSMFKILMKFETDIFIDFWVVMQCAIIALLICGGIIANIIIQANYFEYGVIREDEEV